MTLDQAQIDYMKQTLGVRSVLVGAGEAPQEASYGSAEQLVQAVENENQRYILLSYRPLSQAESGLIQNIIKALGAPGFGLVTVREESLDSLASALTGRLSQKRILIFKDLLPGASLPDGEVQSLSKGNELLLLAALAPMLGSDPQTVNAQKKKIWDQLLPFR